MLRRNLADNERTCLFIMLNPSTADDVQDDPTIRRCIGYARRWGFGKLTVCNIFAYRSTDPDVLFEIDDPVGLDNLSYIRSEIRQAVFVGGIVVCAWGVHGEYWDQGNRIISMIKELGVQPYCLKMTKGNQPSHPLYLKADLKITKIP